ncbi:hypothetical protein L1987_51628 [Smallanthus sonchifolius]|uniref:Uncharacterized protein n=1 Tax=Smallanthus sonchifolius TaxID=185202 RepID=A0ACB9ERY2_9ASTR|nr:hypothetical protein L1987_51628 [Smallanthus sonchifolius]
MDGRSSKPDYGRIFGGFRDQDDASSYEELVARDKARAPSSTSQSSQDLDDLSHQSSDALKQFNMSYNKISQRSKDGLDATTHVTQLQAVPGFTCFIDESASQPNKETVKEKLSSTNNNVKSSKRDLPEKQATKSNVNANSSKRDFPEKQTSQSSVEFRSRYQEESLSDDRNFKNFEADLKSHPSKVLSSPESKKEAKKHNSPATNSVPSSPPAASQPKKETEKQKSPVTNNIHPSEKVDFPEKQTSQIGIESQSRYGQDESLSDGRNFKTFQADFKSYPSKVLSSSESKKVTKKQKSPATNSVPSSPPAASQPKKETEKQKSPVTNNVHASEKVDFPEKQTPQIGVASQSRYGQDESFSDGGKFKTFQADSKSCPSKVLSSPESKKETKKQKSHPSSLPAASQPKKEIEKQKSPVTNNVHPSEKVDFPEKQTSQTGVESQSRYGQDEYFSDNRNFKTFQADFKSYPSKVSSPPAASATNLDNHKDYQKRSTVKNEEFPPTCFDEELDVDSVAAVSTAALRKAIEKAQESIRIAKESVGRKKGGLRGFSSKSFKDSLKVKARVANVNAGEEQKEKDDRVKERDHKNGSTVVFQNFSDGEKLFGAKKVVNEIHRKISESVKNSEVELTNNKMVCNPKQVVGETETESVENNSCEDPTKDDERQNGFLVLESCEKELGGTECNNLTVCQKVETEKKISQPSDQNGYEKKFSEESFRLLENNIQENLEQEHDEKVVTAERQDEDERQMQEDGGTESHREEEKFYDVCEVEMIKNAQAYSCNIETNDLSQKETSENSSSDYDDAEENENVIGASNIVDDTGGACKVNQNDNNAASQDNDDVSSSHEFQVEYQEAVKKEIFENICSDETEDKQDELEAKSDNMENCGFADMDIVQNDVQVESPVDTIHGMEIEVKENKEREETVEKEDNLQQSHEETPEIRTEMDTGTPQEPKVACREPDPSKVVDNKEERERERIKLAVERAIREARERAFAEVRQRVIADTQEKVTKASIDKTSAQSKLRAERALVERATAEARQRALEKAMKISEPRTQVNGSKQTSYTSQTNTESALRSKAKLEKHNRIMERAAKALAEKERRDLLALKEQAERRRLAEHLDADIKRWSTGKEGNLRALLSTLQYILGPESGWQSVSLTEIITATAVKRAYRKATLCVHPDKLQQRGASIQQKYICEKVFDLLKAAWNRFTSEER